MLGAQGLTLKQKAVACAVSCSQKGLYVEGAINRRAESGTMRSRSFSALLAYTVSGGTLYGACTGFNTTFFGEELCPHGGAAHSNSICDTEMTAKLYMYDKTWLNFGNVMCKKLRVGGGQWGHYKGSAASRLGKRRAFQKATETRVLKWAAKRARGEAGHRRWRRMRAWWKRCSWLHLNPDTFL